MLALTAASPIFRGHLVDTDVRWNMIAQSVDDRTRQERGLEPLTSAPQTLSKSRYESISCYISNDSSLFRPEYNDIPIPTNPKVYKQLSDAGIDHLLAQHMSHLFVRDPLVVFSEKIDQDDSSSSDHFENIQSTNWQTVRFKPPPPHSPIGWRVEFRPMEVSLTDFENAAFTVFTILISRVILSLKLNLYQPISMVDANMARAHSRNAVNTQSFTFRKNIQDTKGGEYAEMSIDTLMNGKEGEFPGFVPLIEQYLDQMEVDYDTRAQINCYLCLIRKRANGSLPSTATYLRDFVTSHPDYAQDSIVSDSIAYDLLRRVDEIGLGQTNCEEITGCCTKRKTE
jgi:glutamate--cysteine ligase catalytic subunit